VSSNAPQDRYGYDAETWDRAEAAAGVRAAAGEIFAKVMFLVAVMAGFAAAGAYIGRDLSAGWALGCWIAAFVLVIAVGFTGRKEDQAPLQMGLCFGIGLLLGLAIGPTVAYYSSLEDGGQIVAQAAGLTALFMAAMGTVGYLTKRDLTWLGRISFVALLGLILFGLVAIFVSIPNEALVWSVLGLVIFAGLTVFDFNRLRRAGQSEVVMIALSIFLDAFNVFLFFLQLLGLSRD
jgi:modulator of FtsH protease